MELCRWTCGSRLSNQPWQGRKGVALTLKVVIELLHGVHRGVENDALSDFRDS